MEDTTIKDVLKTVEALYDQKDYTGSLQTLESQKASLPPGLWHYNMGTLFGKLENWPMARFHLMMADAAGFTSKELFQNKELVELKLDIQKYEKPLGAMDYLIKGSLVGTQGIFTLLALLFITGGLISVWRIKSIKIMASAISFAIILFALNFWIGSWKKLIVIRALPLHEGPSVIFGAKEEIPAGVFLVTQEKGDWLKVIYPSRFEGWVKETGLKELK
jgi:hypothetical protein